MHVHLQCRVVTLLPGMRMHSLEVTLSMTLGTSRAFQASVAMSERLLPGSADSMAVRHDPVTASSRLIWTSVLAVNLRLQ
jgi:hypothetical protein